MKIALINGSPRGIKSNSLYILNGLKCYMEKYEKLEFKEFTWSTSNSGEEDFDEAINCEAIVYSFPLYVDSIPSHLLRNLVNFEKYIMEKELIGSNNINVYVLVNNGFFDGKQNSLAIECMENFCNKVGFNFKQGLGIGGGGMLSSIEGVPFGKGPKRSVGNQLEIMANNIVNGENGDNVFVEPNFPAFIYKILAHMGWRMQIRKNGLKSKDLGRRIT